MSTLRGSVVPRTVLAPLALLLVVVAINFQLSPLFLTAANLSSMLSLVLEVAILAVPMTFLITAGHIDLSVASMVGVCSAVIAKSAEAGFGLVPCVLLALLAGVACGAVNGFFVVRLGLNSIVVTIGTLALFRGIAEILLKDQTYAQLPESLLGWDYAYIPGTNVTGPQIFTLVLFLAGAVVLNLTPVGRRVNFLGRAADVARFSGVRNERITFGLFVLSGAVSAIAAVVLVSRLQSVRNDTGSGLELLVITCVLIGGTDIRGGRGTILGTLVAVVAIGSVRSGLGLANVPDEARTAVVGGILVLSISLTVLRNTIETRLAARRSRRAVATHTSSKDNAPDELAHQPG